MAEKACVVCGMKSSRSDWQDTAAPACDSHTKDEVNKALKSQAKANGK